MRQPLFNNVRSRHRIRITNRKAKKDNTCLRNDNVLLTFATKVIVTPNSFIIHSGGDNYGYLHQPVQSGNCTSGTRLV